MRNPSSSSARRLITVCGLSVAMIAVFHAGAAAQVSGAVFTTASLCSGTNVNIFDLKDDVYLDGGPRKEGAAGLPDGDYYVKVTSPDGTLLGTTVGYQGAVVEVAGGEFALCYQLSAILNRASNGQPGYDDTPNNGGEYKVWISKDPGFAPSESKTDNFKVLESDDPDVPGDSTISGLKFYDKNVNGVKDADEPGIQGWRIQLHGATAWTETDTDATGHYVFLNVDDGTYNVCEVIPSFLPKWLATTPTVIGPVTVPPDSTGNDFGNVCLGPGGGHTLGFWSNRNGQRMIDAGDLAALAALNLRAANGADFNPASASALRTWLLGGTATNMAYMLSVQLAAMKLNTLNPNGSPFVSASAIVYAGSCGNANGFITIGDLMDKANTSLGLYPNTLAGHPERAAQECLKNALDAANNNENFVQAEPCDVNYSNTEPACYPAP